MTKWADQIYFKSAIDESKVGGIGILYNDNSVPQSIYLGYGNTPWNNGLKIDNNITFNNQKIYHQGFKPTSSEIGAVNKSGDTMIGNLFFNAAQCNMPIGIFMNAANNMNRGLEYYDKNQNFMGGFGATANQDRIQKIYMGTTRTPWDGNKTLTVDGDGAYFDNQKIYHKGNKPTPEEIGALPSNGTAIHSKKVGQTYVSVPCYNFENGVLIDTGVIAGQSTMFSVIIKGNGYSAVQPINCSYCFYDYTQNEGIVQTSGVSLCGAINLKVFRYQGKVYLWAKQTSNFQTLIFEITLGNRSNLDPNTIVIQNAAMPTSGVSHLREIVPEKAYTTGNKPTTSEINAVNKSGDNIKGTLKFSTVGNEIEIMNPSQGFQARGMVFKDNFNNNNLIGMIGAHFNGEDLNKLFIGVSPTPWDGVKSFIVDKQFCYFDNNKIYHEGFKPTPESIGAISKQSPRIKEGSLNNVVNSGFYAVQSSTVSDIPVHSDGRMIVSAWDWGSWSSQMYFPDGGGIFHRMSLAQDGTSWTNWAQIYTTSFKPTPEDIGALGKTQKAVDSDKLRGLLLSEPSTNYRGIAFVANDGVMEVGKYIDFHLPGQDKDYDVRLEAGSDGMLYCYPGFVGDDFYANKYIRIRDWYGAATDGKLWFKGDGRIMATHEVNVFQCEKFKALSGGITSDGQIYAYQTDLVADRNVIFGGRAISTLQSGESNLFAEGRQSAHGYGWHFANLNGQYSDIYAKIYHQQSDARTKEEVEKRLSLLKDNETVLEKISKVNPKEFYYAEDISKKILYGFFAQELETEFPLAVNTFNYSQEEIESGDIIFPKDKDGQDIHDLKSIDPVAISAIMWDALKEVYNSLEIQKIKNKELLDRIKVLEEKIK